MRPKGQVATDVVLAALLLAALAAFALALGTGSVPGVLTALVDSSEGAGARSAVLWQLRLPRALSAFAAGGLLALAGCLLQALLRNPLADAYVLGVSGGAAVGALLALLAGAGLAGMQAGSALGAFATLAALFLLARRAFFGRLQAAARVSEEASTAVLLTGVMLAAFAAALLSLLLALAPDAQMRSIMFWLLGDLAGATDLRAAALAIGVLAGLLALATTQARPLNLLLRGDLQAFVQGVDVRAVRRRLVLVSALATATSVTLAGAVGFVGFVAPHLMRQLVGNDQRVLLPAAVLAGAVLVLLADTVARTVVAPMQLPVGVLTALIGVPVFIGLVRRR
jgi:iron complex transport system permease protein